jgi:hypothetical protein
MHQVIGSDLPRSNTKQIVTCGEASAKTEVVMHFASHLLLGWINMHQIPQGHAAPPTCSPVPKPGLHTHSADEDAVVFVGVHIPTGQVLLVA